MMGTVMIVDGEERVRNTLGHLLQIEGYSARDFSSAEDCLASLDSIEGPACVIADLLLPGLSGSELQRLLPTYVPFIMLTGHADVRRAVLTMLAGAIDLLEKPIPEGRLVSAVSRALALSAQRKLDHEVSVALQRKVNRLTPREREVMTMITAGLRNKEIANLLGIVEKTVKVHRAHIMQKLEIDSLAEMVRCVDRLEMQPR